MTDRTWKQNLLAAPGIGLSLLPKIACPACCPAYAGLLSSIGLGRGSSVGAGAHGGFVSLRATRTAFRVAIWSHGRWNGIRFQLWNHTYSLHWLAVAFCQCGIWNCGRLRITAQVQCPPWQTNFRIGPLCSRCAEGIPQAARQCTRSPHLRLCLAEQSVSLRRLHMARRLFCSAVPSWRSWHRSRSSGLRAAWISTRAVDWPFGRPLGTAVANTAGTGNCRILGCGPDLRFTITCGGTRGNAAIAWL